MCYITTQLASLDVDRVTACVNEIIGNPESRLEKFLNILFRKVKDNQLAVVLLAFDHSTSQFITSAQFGAMVAQQLSVITETEPCDSVIEPLTTHLTATEEYATATEHTTATEEQDDDDR